MPQRTNPNGLTFDEWLAAAHRSEDKGKGVHTLILISAWQAGEDPCEWDPKLPIVEGSPVRVTRC